MHSQQPTQQPQHLYQPLPEEPLEPSQTPTSSEQPAKQLEQPDSLNGGVSFEDVSPETRTANALDYIGIVSTNDFFVQVQGFQNLASKKVEWRMWCARTRVSADIDECICPGRNTQCLKWLRSTAIGVVLIVPAVAGSLLKSMTSATLIGMVPLFHPSMKPVDPMTLLAVLVNVPGQVTPG